MKRSRAMLIIKDWVLCNKLMFTGCQKPRIFSQVSQVKLTSEIINNDAVAMNLTDLKHHRPPFAKGLNHAEGISSAR
jgi:hypothetical protein